MEMKLSKLLMTVAASLMVALVSHAADSASVSGKITFDGKAPKPKKIPTDADPKCAAMHEDSPLLTEDVLVNADDTLHNIHAMPTKSKEFNVGQPNKDMKTMRTFAEPEIMVHFKCDVHPWMSAYVGVMSNPFYSVSGDSGTFSLKD